MIWRWNNKKKYKKYKKKNCKKTKKNFKYNNWSYSKNSSKIANFISMTTLYMTTLPITSPAQQNTECKMCLTNLLE